MVPNLSDLHAESQRNLLDFLRTDLELSFTFADLAERELQMNDREAAARVKGKAEQGFNTIARLLVNADDGGKKDAVQQRLSELRARLDTLQC